MRPRAFLNDRETPRKRDIFGIFLRRAFALHRLRRQDGAQSLVEFALTLPALMLIVSGVMVFGLAFNNYIMLTEATAIGARQLAISRGQSLDPCRTVATAVIAGAPLLTPASMTFRISLNGNVYSGTTCAGTATAGAPSNMVLGTNVIVTVTYPFSLPIFRNFLTSSFQLNAQNAELMQ